MLKSKAYKSDFQLSLEDVSPSIGYASPTILGEEIRKARMGAGLTQEELAFKAGVSRQYVSLLELNEKSPTVDTLIRICRAMGASAGKIVARAEKAP
ncbi:MAG: helix-turn-helix transcriptional regulator [Thermoguttaceae bacterium]